MKKTRSSSRWILLFFSTAISLAIAEMVSRHFSPANPINSYVFDEELGHRRPHLQEGSYVTSEFSTRLKFNSLGFRDREWSLAKPSGVFRIAFVGDSYVEGAQVDAAQLMSSILQKGLAGAGGACGVKTYEVMNFGTSGYGTTQELLLTKNLVLKFQPDLIILGFVTGNDIRNNSLQLDQATSNENSAYRPYFLKAENGTRRLILPSPTTRPIIERSLLQYRILDSFRLAYLLYRTLLKSKYGGALLGKLGLVSQGNLNLLQNIPTDYQVYKTKLSAEWNDAWDATFYALEEFEKLSKEQHIPILLVIIPNREQLDVDYWSEIVEHYPAMRWEQDWNLELPNEMLVRRLKERQISVLDLFPYLRREDVSNLYFPIDGHFTGAGQRLAAEQILRFGDGNRLFCPHQTGFQAE